MASRLQGKTIRLFRGGVSNDGELMVAKVSAAADIMHPSKQFPTKIKMVSFHLKVALDLTRFDKAYIPIS